MSAIGQAHWSQLYPAGSPLPRRSALMACFEATGDVVLLGGENANGLHADAWRLQGNAWTQMVGPLPPSRGDAQMVYDATRQRLVLFGGYSNGPVTWLDDTWEWDGAVWSSPNPVQRPIGRGGFAMAFDRVRGQTVLFGGYGAANYADLWEWNGALWQQRVAAGGPGQRAAALMAFDPVHGNVLLHGGTAFPPHGPTFCNDTWSWNGTAWQQYLPATPPPFRVIGAAVSDLHRQRVVLHGGDLADAYAWEWDGYEWSLRLQASPSARMQHVMAYDTTRRRVVLFGGFAGYSNYTVNDTWIFRTSTPANAVPFGAGCAGSAGVPQLAAAPYQLPWLGDTFTNRVSNLAPTVGGVVFATGFASTLPISLAPFGMPGCDQLVVPAVSEFRVATAGAADWTLVIPNTAALASVHLFQQAFALDFAANAAGLVASNGSELTTGIR